MKKPFDLEAWNTCTDAGKYLIDKYGIELTFCGKDEKYDAYRFRESNGNTERIYDHPENHVYIVTYEDRIREVFKRMLLKFHQDYSAYIEMGKPEEENKKLVENAIDEILAMSNEMHISLDSEVNKAYNSGMADGRFLGDCECMDKFPYWRVAEHDLESDGNDFLVQIVVDDEDYIEGERWWEIELRPYVTKGEKYINVEELTKLRRFTTCEDDNDEEVEL